MYDGNGSLTADQDKGLRVFWTPQGKIREVRSKVDSVVIHFRYDAAGHKVEKKVVKPDTAYVVRYITDFSGSVMTIYADTVPSEQIIYGTSKLGVYKGGVKEGKRRLDRRRYELVNHLGNVLVVISDKVAMKDSLWATVMSATDYYPFGSAMKGRTIKESYRYGFNGSEREDAIDIAGYDFGARIYDSRIGRWLSVDPAFKDYPSYTPYNFGANSPIVNIDSDGKRIYFVPGLGYRPEKPEKYVPGIESALAPYLAEHNTYAKTINGSAPSNSKNALLSRLPDMKFVVRHGQKPALSAESDVRIINTVKAIAADIVANPQQPGEQINVMGTSQGSVTVAQAAIFLVEHPEDYGLGKDFKIDNLVLVGSPVDKKSELYAKLESLKQQGKIGEIRYDEYQSKDENGKINDQVTALAGKNKLQAVVRGLGFLLDAMLGRKGNHPHLRAAANKPTEEPYNTFGEQLQDKLKKDNVH